MSVGARAESSGVPVGSETIAAKPTVAPTLDRGGHPLDAEKANVAVGQVGEVAPGATKRPPLITQEEAPAAMDILAGAPAPTVSEPTTPTAPEIVSPAPESPLEVPAPAAERSAEDDLALPRPGESEEAYRHRQWQHAKADLKAFGATEAGVDPNERHWQFVDYAYARDAAAHGYGNGVPSGERVMGEAADLEKAYQELLEKGGDKNLTLEDVGKLRKAKVVDENARLGDSDRLVAAQRVLREGRLLQEAGPLTSVQEEAILAAHAVGNKDKGKNTELNAGVGNYTTGQLLEKTRILKEAGFTASEIRPLMESGIVGSNPEEGEQPEGATPAEAAAEAAGARGGEGAPEEAAPAVEEPSGPAAVEAAPAEAPVAEETSRAPVSEFQQKWLDKHSLWYLESNLDFDQANGFDTSETQQEIDDLRTDAAFAERADQIGRDPQAHDARESLAREIATEERRRILRDGGVAAERPTDPAQGQLWDQWQEYARVRGESRQVANDHFSTQAERTARQEAVDAAFATYDQRYGQPEQAGAATAETSASPAVSEQAPQAVEPAPTERAEEWRQRSQTEAQRITAAIHNIQSELNNTANPPDVERQRELQNELSNLRSQEMFFGRDISFAERAANIAAMPAALQPAARARLVADQTAAYQRALLEESHYAAQSPNAEQLFAQAQLEAERMQVEQDPFISEGERRARLNQLQAPAVPSRQVDSNQFYTIGADGMRQPVVVGGQPITPGSISMSGQLWEGWRSGIYDAMNNASHDTSPQRDQNIAAIAEFGLRSGALTSAEARDWYSRMKIAPSESVQAAIQGAEQQQAPAATPPTATERGALASQEATAGSLSAYIENYLQNSGSLNPDTTYMIGNQQMTGRQIQELINNHLFVPERDEYGRVIRDLENNPKMKYVTDIAGLIEGLREQGADKAELESLAQLNIQLNNEHAAEVARIFQEKNSGRINALQQKQEAGSITEAERDELKKLQQEEERNRRVTFANQGKALMQQRGRIGKSMDRFMDVMTGKVVKVAKEELQRYAKVVDAQESELRRYRLGMGKGSMRDGLIAFLKGESPMDLKGKTPEELQRIADGMKITEENLNAALGFMHEARGKYWKGRTIRWALWIFLIIGPAAVTILPAIATAKGIAMMKGGK